MTENKKLLAVAGPTASGKTALSVELAEAFSGEVISCDSMQLYKGLDIGTAKPTSEEMRGIPHHLIDSFDMNEAFSVSDYVAMAGKCASDILSRGKLPIVCGGTGFYLDSLIGGIDFGEYENLPGLREELYEIARTEGGAEKLHKELEGIDASAAAEIHPANIKRVIRAIEIFRSSGITPTEQKRRSLLRGKEYDSLVIGICFADRQKLYDRIDGRVDEMVSMGLVEEARGLYEKGLESTPTAGAAIGYKELFPFFRGEGTLEEGVELIKRESRRYAKRQITWLKRNPDILWLCADEMTREELISESKAAVAAWLGKDR